MSYALGTATGRIEIEYDGKGVAQAGADVDGLKGRSEKALGGLNTLGNTAAVAGGAIAAGFAVAANQAATFEQRMSAVQAVSGATGDEFNQLRDKALQLGKDTAFSATEGAQAIEELVKAGMTVPEVMNGAADATVALAAAGEVDLASAAEIASAAMNSFSLEASEAAHVADIMAGAANASATDVLSVGESFKYVAPLASAAGVSMDDTVTAIAALADVGIKGSQAGTTLRAMIQNLQPASDKAADSMEQLGFITKDGQNQFFTASGKMKSMAQVSEILANGLDGLSDKQKSAALSTIFGARAMAGANALALKGKKGFQDLNKVIQDTDATEVAATRMDNLKGRMEEMSGSIETVGIAVGTALLPFIEKLVAKITELADWFLGLSDSQQKWIVGILGAIAALLLIFAAIAKFIIFMNTLKTAFVALRAAAVPTWLATLGPILLVVAAIALVVAIIVLLWKKSETFRNIVLGVWNAVKSGTIAAFNAIKNAVVTAWNWIKSKLDSTGDAIRSGIINSWNAIKSGVSSAVNAVRSAISNAWNWAKTSTTNAWNAVVQAVVSKIAQVVSDVKGLKDKVMGALGDAGTWLVDKGKEIVQGLIDGIMAMAGKVKGAFDSVVGGIGKLIPGSPVKEGPLRVLNNGYAGKQIVGMVMDGIVDMRRPLQETMATTVALPDSRVDVGKMLDIAPRPPIGRTHGPTQGAASRLVDGTIRLDPSGIVFITGIAEDVYDNFAGND